MVTSSMSKFFIVWDYANGESDACGKNSTEVFNVANAETRTLIESPITKALQEEIVVGLPEQTILIAKNGAEI